MFIFSPPLCARHDSIIGALLGFDRVLKHFDPVSITAVCIDCAPMLIRPAYHVNAAFCYFISQAIRLRNPNLCAVQAVLARLQASLRECSETKHVPIQKALLTVLPTLVTTSARVEGMRTVPLFIRLLIGVA